MSQPFVTEQNGLPVPAILATHSPGHMPWVTSHNPTTLGVPAFGDIFYNCGPITPPTDTFVMDVTEPTAANTATAAKDPGLTQWNGQYNVTDAMGDSVSGLRINGWVDLSARTRDFTFVNCDFPGLPSYDPASIYNQSWAVVQARHTGYSGRLNMDSCRVRPAQPNTYLTCISGERLGKITRCDMSLGSDIIDLWNGASGAEVSGCYLHEYTFWSNDSKHASDTEYPGWCHPDFVQITGGDNYKIHGNAMHVFASQNYGNWTDLRDGLTPVGTGTTGDHGVAYPYLNYGGAVTATAGSAITNLVVNNNWFYGGRTHVINPRQPGGAETGNTWKVRDNLHSYDMHGYPAGSNKALQMIRWGCLVTTGGPADITNNRWMGTDKGVPASLAGNLLPAVSTIGDPTVNTSQYFSAYYTPTQPVPSAANVS